MEGFNANFWIEFQSLQELLITKQLYSLDVCLIETPEKDKFLQAKKYICQ